MKTTKQAVNTIIQKFILDQPDKDNYVLMQYIGLKDKNGKEIYEGDIIRDCEGTIWGYVGYSLDYLMFVLLMPAHGPKMVWSFDDIPCEFKVIGNIYENPKLLEVEP